MLISNILKITFYIYSNREIREFSSCIFIIELLDLSFFFNFNYFNMHIIKVNRYLYYIFKKKSNKYYKI